MTRVTLSGILIVVLFIVVIIVIMALAQPFFPDEQVITPRIIPEADAGPAIPVNASFPFQQENITVSVLVNSSVLQGARNTDKTVTVIGNVTDAVWVSRTYRAMIDDPTQDAVIADLIGEFRKLRAARQLSDDEYLELIALYVQSLQYKTNENTAAKFPVETIADNAGDCDDKSLLLAALLSREGYAVALLSFRQENHMALGIGSDDYRYGTTNYTFLETTNLSFVGIPAQKPGTETTLLSTPIVIPVGSGQKLYTSTWQTQNISNVIRDTETKVRELELQLEVFSSDLDSHRQEIQDMERGMESLQRAGDIRRYNQMVLLHNTKVSEYNSRLNTYNEIFSRYEKYAYLHNYIIDHPYDRKGVYEYILKNLP